MKKTIVVGILALVGVSTHAALITDDFNRPDTVNTTGDM